MKKKKTAEREIPKVRKKLNCWEIKGCERQPGGKKAAELGICPAAVEKKLDGLHGGKNAGRACWLVAGTMCSGKVQGTFAQKYGNCEKCDFFEAVREEERPVFKMRLLKKK
jgi:hypothetical protein